MTCDLKFGDPASIAFRDSGRSTRIGHRMTANASTNSPWRRSARAIIVPIIRENFKSDTAYKIWLQEIRLQMEAFGK